MEHGHGAITNLLATRKRPAGRVTREQVRNRLRELSRHERELTAFNRLRRAYK
jgi:hypothetical protein